MVAEADESDGSFLALSPTIAVVTNIDHEHMDHYGDMAAIRRTFVDFINKIPFYGTAILCQDNEEIQGIIPQLKKRYVTYGMSTQADIRGKDLRMEKWGTSIEVIYQNRSMGRISVGMPGEHNALNALAATAVGLELDLEMGVIREGLTALGGLARRLQIKGEEKSILFMDDYGHHPTEIMATLRTVKACWPEKRLIVAFQPHRYTRTQALLERFVISFNDADVLVVTPIYPAGEAPIENITSENLVRGIREHGHREVILCSDQNTVIPTLEKLAVPGDLVLTLGAGDIHREGEGLMKLLANS